MRPPERINEILELMEQIWKFDPDMRFMQLVYVLQMRFTESQDERGRIIETHKDGSQRIGFDLFNSEDKAFQRFLENYLQKLKEA